jgi:YidC/Oxa1 family membrane protein insertase
VSNNERNSFVAIAICIVFYLGFTQYLNRKYPDYAAGNKSESVESTSATDTATNTPAAGLSAPGIAPTATTPVTPSAPEVPRLSEDRLIIDTPTSVYRFSQDRGSIDSIRLKNYRRTSELNSENIELLDSPLFLRATVREEQNHLSVNGFAAERVGDTIKMWREIPGWRIEQEFRPAAKDFSAEITSTFTNTGTTALDLNAGLFFGEKLIMGQKSAGFSLIPGAPSERPRLVAFIGTRSETLDAESYCTDLDEKGPASISDRVEYAGFDRHYFVTVLTPVSAKADLTSQRIGEATAQRCDIGYTIVEPHGQIQPGQAVQIKYTGYFGPKIVETMAQYNSKLEATLDLGWLDWLAHPLLHAIKGFYKATGNYGVAIIILTLLLKILFYPLTKAAAVSMHKMKKLNPEMAKIREKHKADPRQQQQELMKFMSQHKINPAKGCIPILPQIPVFFAFYRVLSASFELRHAPFFGWIKDLASMDPYYVTPILLGVGMFVQQKLTPTAGMDKTQEKIMMMMPVIFSVMMISLPAGLVLYMLTNTIVSIAQQQWLNKKLDRTA